MDVWSLQPELNFLGQFCVSIETQHCNSTKYFSLWYSLEDALRTSRSVVVGLVNAIADKCDAIEKQYIYFSTCLCSSSLSFLLSLARASSIQSSLLCGVVTIEDIYTAMWASTSLSNSNSHRRWGAKGKSACALLPSLFQNLFSWTRLREFRRRHRRSMFSLSWLQDPLSLLTHLTAICGSGREPF